MDENTPAAAVTPPEPNLAAEERRQRALELSISAYRQTTSADFLIEAAGKFEAFLRGDAAAPAAE